MKASNLTVESYWPSLFAKLCEKRNIDDLIVNVGCGGGGAAPAAVAASAGAGGAAPAAAAPAAEEKKVPLFCTICCLCVVLTLSKPIAVVHCSRTHREQN